MSENNSAGSVSLDLVISDTVEEQLDSITGTARRSAEQIGRAIEGTGDRIRKMLNIFEVSSDPTEHIKQELENAYEKMEMLQKKWQELSAAETSDGITRQLNSTESQIMSTQRAIERLQSRLEEMSRATPEVNVPEFNGLNRSIQYAVDMFKSAFERISSFAEKTGNKVKAVFSGAFKALKTIGGKAIDSVNSRLKGIGKNAVSAAKPITKLGRMLKNTFRRVFITAGILAVYKAIRSGLLDTLKANEQFSKSLNEVKANLSIAFAPIMQAVMPTLNSLMSGLASLTRDIAGFITGLFGTTYKKAAETAQKLKNVTDAAKKAKMSAAGIDEMNILSSGDSSADDEKNGIDYSKIDMSEPELPDWAERLKAAIKSGDWAGVGAIFAERVNSALGSIDWEKLSAKINGGVRKITDGINGFLDNINWETLGDTFAGGINTITGTVNTFYEGVNWSKLGSGIAVGLNRAIKKIMWKEVGKAFSARIQALIETLYSFVTTFDWSGFGSSIGEAVNGWFECIDFGKAGAALSGGIKGILDTAINFVQTVNWRQIGEKIAAFLANIDWTGIAKRFFTLFGSALGGAVSLLWGAIGGAVAAIGNYFSEKFEECGGNVFLGLLKGILDGVASIGKWIRDNIFKPFIDGFKKAFGIASPSKEMAKMGGYIVEGLYNAVADGITKIKEIFEKMLKVIKGVFSSIGSWFGDRWKDIKDAFSKSDSWFKERFTAARDNIKSVFGTIGSWFGDRWNDIKGAFSAVGSWFGETFSTAWENIKSVFENPGEFFGSVWTAITNCFGHVTDWFSDTFSKAWQAVKDVFSAGGEIFTGITDGIAETFKTVVNGLIDGLNWIIAQPFNAINDALDGLRYIDIMGVEPFGWLPSISIPEIPYLAQGTVVPANYGNFLAVLGDNKRETEVVSPLSTIEKAVVNALTQYGGFSDQPLHIHVDLDGREIGRVAVKAVNRDKARRGV